MDSIKLGKSDIISSRIVYGCLRIVGDNSIDSRKKGKQAVRTAIEEGYTHFDHADVYGRGKCEELFSEVLQEYPEMRDRLIITSKCGIRKKYNPDAYDPAHYNFSKEHIIKSVEGSLSRLKVDYLDILLLHLPDYLLDAEEVSEAFRKLHESSKVLNFGVSNFRPSQISFLQSYLSLPLLMNQVEINIHNINALLDGTLDQCQELKITPEAWSPLGGVAYPAYGLHYPALGLQGGNTFSKEDEVRIKSEFDLQSHKYDTENWIIMLSWLLKHPAQILPIIGTTNPLRIQAAKKALDIDYSREDWYRLLEARNGCPVP